MARMPGAVWRPIPVSSTRPRRRTGRGICLHVAVSESSSLFGFFSTAEVDSHFYVAKDGTIEQYVDTALVAYANRDGNSTLISVETQGGVTNVDGEPWTPAQVAALAKLVKWAASSDGFPLQPMTNSLLASRGVGYHRLGVDPYRISGGELWSSSYGKVCPGAAKIRQIPQIITLAKGATPEEDMPLTTAEKNEIAALSAKATVAALLAADVSEQYDGVQSFKNVLSQVWTNSREDLSDNDALIAAVKALPASVRAALADAIVQVDVNVAGQQQSPPPAA